MSTETIVINGEAAAAVNTGTGAGGVGGVEAAEGSVVVVTTPPPWYEVVRGYLPENELAATAVAAGALVLIAIAAHFIARQALRSVFRNIARRSPTAWDDVLLEHRVPARLVTLLPLVILHRGLVFVPGLGPALLDFLQRLLAATIVLIAARALGAFLSAVNAIYSRYPIAAGRPIKGYLQVVKIAAYIAAGIVAVAMLIGQSPVYLLSGLGAMTAIIMLIFRDTILSLVAGIQLTGNDLIRVGDWIEMPQFNADGFVIDISLNVVKVHNWDKSVTTIPAHKFLENSFRNWRDMFDGGGRRIKRSIHIDMNTVRFLRPEEVKRFCRFVALRDYMHEKIAELEAHNRTRVERDYADVVANGRHLTNLGTLRAYISNYLRRHPMINQEMTFLVRHLQPTPQGLPIEIYVFTKDTRWAYHEGVQADVFDHILAVLPEFGLRVFQEPAGSDVAGLARRIGQATGGADRVEEQGEATPAR